MEPSVVVVVVDAWTLLHADAFAYWVTESDRIRREDAQVLDKLAQLDLRLATTSRRDGDKLVKECRDLFYHGFGVEWGDAQAAAFDAFLISCLPLLYGNTWDSEKSRVLKIYGLEEERYFSIVMMNRRNGKTMGTSGATATLLLKVPGLSVAIFSIHIRASGMLMDCVKDMIERAFERGTHVKRENYRKVSSSVQRLEFLGPDKTKRKLGSYPGSAKVSSLFPCTPHTRFRCTLDR